MIETLNFICVLAVCNDIRDYRIPNSIIVTGWIGGFIYQLLINSYGGILIFVKGALAPIILLIILFVFRLMGAGDIKLLSVIGGYLGPKPVILCFILSVIFNSIISIGKIIFNQRLVQRFSDFFKFIFSCVKEKRVNQYYKISQEKEGAIHYSIGILCGVILYTEVLC